MVKMGGWVAPNSRQYKSHRMIAALFGWLAPQAARADARSDQPAAQANQVSRFATAIFSFELFRFTYF